MLRRIDQTIRPLWSPRRLVLLAFLLGLMLAGLVLTAAYSADQALNNCRRVAHIDQVVQQLGVRGLRTVGTKGSAGFAYYQTHPEELRVAREQLQNQVRDFKPGKCTLL